MTATSPQGRGNQPSCLLGILIYGAINYFSAQENPTVRAPHLKPDLDQGNGKCQSDRIQVIGRKFLVGQLANLVGHLGHLVAI